MSRYKWLALLIVFLPSLTLAQSTTVSGNVTDLGGQVWFNGTVVATFVNPHGTGNSLFTWSGGFFNPNLAITAAINGSGNYTMSVPSNTAIIPSQSQWTLTVNSGTTGLSTQTVTLTITGGTQTVNFTPPALAITATSMSVAYVDSEVSAQTGQFYYNLTLTQPRVCQASTGAICTTWAAMGSGGGGSGTVTHTAGPLTSGQLIFGNNTADIKVGDLTGDVTTSGTPATFVAKIQGTTVTLTAPANGQLLFISGGSIVNGFPGLGGRVVSGTSDPVTTADRAATIQYTSGSAIGESLPSAATLSSNFTYIPFVTGAGALTITPTTSTINGQGTLILGQNVWCGISSPDNVNYLARCANWIKAGTNLTAVANADGSTTLNASATSVAFQVNGIPTSNQSTINFQNSSAFNGLTATFSNPSAGNVQLGFSGTLSNAGLTFSSTTVNGNTCTLGSSCIVTLDQVGNPAAPVLFTFLATQGLTLNGTQPAPVSGAGTAAGTLVTMTAPKGGNSTLGTGGQGGGFVWQPGTGGDSTTGRGQGGFAQFLMPLSGAAGTGAALPGRFLVDYNSAGNSNGTWCSASASAPGGCLAGLAVRNTSDTVGNTVNNISPSLGMSAHMIINNTDTEVRANFVLANGIPGTGSIANVNTNNPDITVLLEVPSLSSYGGTLHFELEHGGPALWCFYVSPSVCGDGGLYNRGAQLHIGSPTQQQNSISFQTAGSIGAGIPDLFFLGHGNSGTAAGCAGDDNQATNRTWVWCSELINGSGGNIVDGTLVKMSATADQITPILHTDTPTNLIIGVVIVPGGGNCASAAVCHVAWGGTLNGVIKMGTASCAIGNAVIPDTTTDGEVKCVAAGSATAGQILGIAMSAQATPGNTVDVAIRIH